MEIRGGWKKSVWMWKLWKNSFFRKKDKERNRRKGIWEMKMGKT